MRLIYVFPEELPIKKARAIQVVKTVAALSAQGVDVDLVYAPVAGECPFAYYGVPRPERVSLVPISRGISVFPRLKSGALFFYRFRKWLFTSAAVRNVGKTILFVRHLKFAHRLLASGIHIPVVFEAHEIFADAVTGRKAKKLAQLEQVVLEQSATVIAITEQLAALLSARYHLQRRIHILPSATDLPAVVPGKPWSEAGQHIAYTGSLYGWKGVDDLVAAAALLPETLTITIVGGEHEEIARLQSQQAATGAKIVYRGHLSHQETLQVLAETCIAILPNRAGSVSLFTSPLKLFEYMAMGCVVVASDLPVFREILGEQEAFWFDVGNPEGLAAAIRQALGDVACLEQISGVLANKAQQYSWQGRAIALFDILNGTGITVC